MAKTLEERVATLEAQVARLVNVDMPTQQSITTGLRTDMATMKERAAKDIEVQRRKLARRR